jgi:RNA polymerase sigma-70 factor (ECF subfamily)
VSKEALSARETFARLYDEYLDKVFRYIQYKVNNIQLAEDLTSTVFEKALANFSKYSNDRALFSTWIFSIARNVVIDHYRVSRKRKALSLEEVTAQSSSNMSPEEEVEREDEREKLRVCLAKLSEEEQEIIQLKFGAELNNRQISKMLGVSESNVGTKLYRAIRKLRDSFRESENGQGNQRR